MIMQGAAEAAKSTSSIVLDGAAIMAIITAGILYLKTRRIRRNGNPNEPNPGTAPICIERGEKIAVMGEKFKDIEGDLSEIKGDIKKLLGRVPPRE